MTAAHTRILLVPGSLREGSTNAAVLSTAEAVAPDHVSVSRCEGMSGSRRSELGSPATQPVRA